MRVWKVMVRCIGEKPAKKLGNPPKIAQHWINVLVEAEDSDHAMANGTGFAEGKIPVDVRWKELTAMSASSVSFPCVLDTL